MYLAIKEILRNKLRYSLILTTIFLIAFMVFFMTSLALGLVRNNRAAIDNWQATGVVLSDYANDNLTASFIPEKDYKDCLLYTSGSRYLGRFGTKRRKDSNCLSLRSLRSRGRISSTRRDLRCHFRQSKSGCLYCRNYQGFRSAFQSSFCRPCLQGR